MSQLDQAFIKAFGKRTAKRVAPAGPSGPRSAASHAAAPVPSPKVAKVAGNTPSAAILNPAEPAPPAPHINVAQAVPPRPVQTAVSQRMAQSAAAPISSIPTRQELPAQSHDSKPPAATKTLTESPLPSRERAVGRQAEASQQVAAQPPGEGAAGVRKDSNHKIEPPKAAAEKTAAPPPVHAPSAPAPSTKPAASILRTEPAAQRVPAPHITSFTTSASAGVDGSLSVAAPPPGSPLKSGDSRLASPTNAEDHLFVSAPTAALPQAAKSEQPPRIVEPVRPPAPIKTSEPETPRPLPPPAAPVASPLSSPSIVQSSPPPPRLRPLFEVDRLPWPPLCQSLARAAQSELKVVADELLARARRGEKLILFTSLHRGEGCTTTALCLTRLLAGRGANCALVDADFAQGQMVRQLKLLPQAGWEQVLRGDLPLDEALVESMEDHVTVLPLQGPLSDLQLLTQPARMAASLDQLREEYDLVVVDSGPLNDRAAGLERLIGAAKFDAAIAVQDVRRTRAADLERLLAELRSIPRVEIAENFLAVTGSD